MCTMVLPTHTGTRSKLAISCTIFASYPFPAALTFLDLVPELFFSGNMWVEAVAMLTDEVHV